MGDYVGVLTAQNEENLLSANIGNEAQVTGSLNSETENLYGVLNNNNSTYGGLSGKPQIEGVVLVGNKNLSELKIQINVLVTQNDWSFKNGKYYYVITVSDHDLGMYAIVKQVERTDESNYKNVFYQYERLSNGSIQIMSDEPFDGRIILEKGSELQ